MVTAASPFFACMQLRDKWSCWRFEKTFVPQKKLSFWPSEVALPFIPAPCGEVVHSSCLGVWIVELEVNGLPALYSSCDLDDSVVWKSILRPERTLPYWGSLEIRQWPGELEMERRELHTLRFWRFVDILCTHSSWWLLFETIFGKLFGVPRTFGFVFRDQRSKYFQTR